MTNRILTALALSAAFLGTAAAASDQLALQLGVEPGAYSTADLVSLKDAREAGDSSREAFILDHSGDVAVSRSASLKAFAASDDFDGAAQHSIDNYVAVLDGERSVSATTVAFAQSQLSDVNDD